MKIRHPDSEHTVETENPEPYVSQGWVEVKSAPAKKATPKSDEPEAQTE